jgi:hypothetical protein
MGWQLSPQLVLGAAQIAFEAHDGPLPQWHVSVLGSHHSPPGQHWVPQQAPLLHWLQVELQR